MYIVHIKMHFYFFFVAGLICSIAHLGLFLLNCEISLFCLALCFRVTLKPNHVMSVYLLSYSKLYKTINFVVSWEKCLPIY